MNGFLVVLRASCDDIPVRLFDNMVDTILFVNRLPEHYQGESTENHPDVEAVCEKMSIDITTFCCVTVFTFRDGEVVAVDPHSPDDDE